MIPEKLRQRLEKLGMNENIYEQRSRKCILSREPLALEKVPWHEHAYYIPDDIDKKDEGRTTRNERTLKASCTSVSQFVFDPVSLVPCLALDPHRGDKILDMCAAPGTKTFIMSFLAENGAHIIANDISRFRVMRLKSVINKYSLSAEAANMSGRKISSSFGKILLDAPCSGEGMVNKKEKLFEHWSEKRVKRFSKTQKKLLLHAFELLKQNGTLIYSTCTFEPEENEGVIDALLKKHDNAHLEDVEVNISHASGITEWEGAEYDANMAKCMRIYPFHNNTGGFFVSRITKK